MAIGDILQSMRNGETQSDAAIDRFVAGVVDGSVTRPQAGAWLAWAFQRGLSEAETASLTRAMTHSGDIMKWSDGPDLVDKHSTGGVGDKVSLVLAPLWAELGLRVPMISGRGLGHTGGTLDKLESIPGYRTDLPVGALRRQLDEVGCFISGQTDELAPADRVLYALRNETCTVPSIPLIVASILSKKLAEGVQRLVLDVKTGSGAFMTTLEGSYELAQALVGVATAAGVQASAVISEMGRPLGRCVGNALEVRESIACLQGRGPSDLRELVLTLADDPRAAAVLDSGAALERFGRMVEAQGGERGIVDEPERLLGAGVDEHIVVAQRDGVITGMDALAVGRAVFLLGAGRRHAGAGIDMGVGLQAEVAVGDSVVAGQPLLRVWHREGRELARACEFLHAGLSIGEAAMMCPPLVHAVVRG